MQRRGSLNVGQRVEFAVAMLLYAFNRSHGGKGDVWDFAPHWDQPEASIDDIARMFGITDG